MIDSALYDEIGVGYARFRRPDPRIEAAIEAALGSARTVLNVGAGTGSYEPRDRTVLAVEQTGGHDAPGRARRDPPLTPDVRVSQHRTRTVHRCHHRTVGR